MASFDFEAIGTGWSIDVDGQEGSLPSAWKDRIKEIVEEFDAAYSRFRSDSLVSAMAVDAGTYTLPDNALTLITFYRELYEVSDGAITPLIGKAISQAGYDATYSLVPSGEILPVPAWDEVLDYIHPKLVTREAVMLDFGAAGKGYLVDLIAAFLQEAGVTTCTIDAGGDILQAASDHSSVRIGLEHPEDTSKAIGVAEISNMSLCGSASNRRAWGTYHHIMNPSTLKSASGILATWVVAETTMVADGLATSLFLVDADTLQERFAFEYVILKSDYTVNRSHNFPAEIFV